MSWKKVSEDLNRECDICGMNIPTRPCSWCDGTKMIREYWQTEPEECSECDGTGIELDSASPQVGKRRTEHSAWEGLPTYEAVCNHHGYSDCEACDEVFSFARDQDIDPEKVIKYHVKNHVHPKTREYVPDELKGNLFGI